MPEGSERGHEREFKLGIADETSMRSLVAHAGGRVLEPLEQINHYFDSRDGGLRGQRIGVRIRQESDRYILTLKGPAESDADPMLSVRAELEIEIDRARAQAVLSGALPVSAMFDLLAPSARRVGLERLLESAWAEAVRAPMTHVGSFGNLRTPVRTHFEIEGREWPVLLEFDRTEFGPGDLRFEVELELNGDDPVTAIREALEALFARAGVTPIPTTSKLSYFLKKLDRNAERAGRTRGPTR